MDSGPSWADQWDTHQDPPLSNDNEDKKKDANKSGARKLQEKIMKIFGRKSQK
ncbi:hypothetical protein RND81_07G203500 [Saponaria officinalis]|uniref:Uncharacterized protein n=1 Tax=Saponaria officinalis TaxID=3572 RepID=A0AAW1JSY0_SAPOF